MQRRASNAKDATDLDIRLFCQPIAELLRSLNVPAEVNGRNDISIEGKKFSGNSQYLKQGRIMHHGTLMFHSDLSVVADVLNVSADKFQSKAAKSVKARVTNIAPYLPEGFTLAQFKALLLKYILKEENVQPYVFSAEELAEVEKYELTQYNEMANYHKDWADAIKASHPETSSETVSEIVKQAVGRTFIRVLEDAGVYKRNRQGQAAFMRFVESIGVK